jgi:hypothetical protein
VPVLQLQQLWRSCGEARILSRANTVEDARCVGEAATRFVRVQSQSVQMCNTRSKCRRTGASVPNPMQRLEVVQVTVVC